MLRHEDSEPEALSDVLRGRMLETNNVSRSPVPKPARASSVDSRREFPDGIDPQSHWGQVPDGVRSAVRAAVARKRWPLVLAGPVGTGKTTIAALVYRGWHLADGRNGTCRWRLCDELLSQIYSARLKGHVITFTPNGETVKNTESGLRRAVRDADLLVLDDLGRAQVRDDQYSILLDVLDSRAHKPTIITTNKTIEQLDEVYDTRLVSRISRHILPITGRDRRQD